MRGVGNYATFFTKAPQTSPKHNSTLEVLRTVIDPKRTAAAVLDFVVGHLRGAFSHYTWVGIYLLEGDTLKLAAWRGGRATEHASTPIGQGICGLAARTKQTVVGPGGARGS